MTNQSNKSHSFLAIIKQSTVFLLLAVFILSGCSFPTKFGSKGFRLTSSNDLNIQLFDIEFQLQLPQDISTKEKILIEILDEVTGLGNNRQVHALKKVDSQTYLLKLSFPAGSIIKYRYIRNSGDVETYEASYYNQPVRYRMLLADSNRSVSDILHAWGNEPASIDAGNLSGEIIDHQTQEPIPDIIVSAGGQLALTDANGVFQLHGLAVGEHNVVFYAIDGKFRTHQQGAVISARAMTPVSLEMVQAKPVTVSFRVTVPEDARGAPIYLAGNLFQLGNTFSELLGGMTVHTKQMPALVLAEDGVYHLDLSLPAGVDLHYKYTLGDGYWNTERDSDGESFVRQMIVPDYDLLVDQKIESWRTPGIGPITFDIIFPPVSSPNDEKYIQLKQEEWTAPLPLWPLGNGKYLYILYSPLELSDSIAVRFCRNADCESGLNRQSEVDESQIAPEKADQTVNLTIDQWERWSPLAEVSVENTIPLPAALPDYSTVIEFSPDLTPGQLPFINAGLSTIAQSGTQMVVLTPKWEFEPGTGLLQPLSGTTPFVRQLVSISQASHLLSLDTGIYPQISSEDHLAQMWLSGAHSEAWWKAWFEDYSRFILNYAKIAQLTDAKWLIIGGNSALPTFPGGVLLDGHLSDVPETSEAFWRELIVNIRKIYKGDLLWATHAHLQMDPLPEFIGIFDGIYLSIDSPLSDSPNPAEDEIAYGFTKVIDNLIYEVYRSTEKPIVLALAYPSVDKAAQGCLAVNLQCQNDGLFLNNELIDMNVDLNEQYRIYESILPVVASRDWIRGMAIRGYQPSVAVMDGSSSVAGKPVAKLIFQWFQEIAMNK